MNKIITRSQLITQTLIFSFLSGSLLSCTQPAKKNIPEEKRPEHKEVVRIKPPSGFTDTLIIHFPSVVFFDADSLQWGKLKANTEKNEYESEVHDCFYQMRNARMVLKKYWPEIHVIETTNRYLLFVKGDTTSILIDLDSRGDMCGLFLFDGKNEPEFADMMNIETALGFYFSK